MLISASRRTDIPTYYSEWFYNRIHGGYVLVRNPMNAHQIGRVSLSPDVVDGIVFWTKNPTPMLDRLDELKDYNYYFQFTLNPYSKDIEPNIPSKNDVIIPTFLKLSEAIGADRVIWRYDPIILSEKYTLEYHLEYFEKLAHILASHTRKCTFSFLDLYKNTEKNVRSLNLRPISSEDMITLAKGFHEIALGYGLKLDTCAEQIDLSDFGISHGGRTVKIGGIANDDGRRHLIRFYHPDNELGDLRITLVGTNTGGFALKYAPDDPTGLDPEITATPSDGEGTLILIDETDPGALGTLAIASAPGTTSGKTALTVTPPLTGGNSYKYKTAPTVTLPALNDSTATGYTAWDGTAEISATTGNEILVVEVDATGAVKKAGKATVTAKV